MVSGHVQYTKQAMLSSNFTLITQVNIQEWIVPVLGGEDKQTNSAHKAFKELFHAPFINNSTVQSSRVQQDGSVNLHKHSGWQSNRWQTPPSNLLN